MFGFYEQSVAVVKYYLEEKHYLTSENITIDILIYLEYF